MDRTQASQDLEIIRRILEQTRRRVDPQMFHLIIWGSIVLVWYPLMTWFERAGNGWAQLYLGIGAIALGAGLSSFLGWRACRRPRLPGANTHLGSQLAKVVAIFVAVGMVLSMAMPTLARGGERYIPHAWGLLYALMLMTMGALYSREFFWCGLPCLAATLAAVRWPEFAGYILGPAMGLGCIVAGAIAERRVARLRGERVEADLDSESAKAGG